MGPNVQLDAVVRLDCGYILNVPEQNRYHFNVGDRVQVFVSGSTIHVSKIQTYNVYSNGYAYNRY
jgi:hypothetical protein